MLSVTEFTLAQHPARIPECDPVSFTGQLQDAIHFEYSDVRGEVLLEGSDHVEEAQPRLRIGDSPCCPERKRIPILLENPRPLCSVEWHGPTLSGKEKQVLN